MIPVSVAKDLILQHTVAERSTELLLVQTRGFVLAETIYAPIDTPPFHQSAMDGYAFAFDDWDGKSPLPINGELAAGDTSLEKLAPSTTIRIFTGAAIPADADTVVIQEKIILENNCILIKDEKLFKGANIRFQGSQTKQGDAVMLAGQTFNPAAISLLASMGIERVTVYPHPTVGIIVTGNELVQPGSPLPAGKIYESNSSTLVAALDQLGIKPNSLQWVSDDRLKLKETILKNAQQDILILTGGISVGDYDLVAGALSELGTTTIFHKVNMKPGKPFYFGKLNQTLIFALPGNPAAVLTCFYMFIVPAIEQFTRNYYFKTMSMPLENGYQKKQGMTYFLKGRTTDHSVLILDDQESYKMNSFAQADCLIELDADRDIFKKEDLVQIHLIK